VRDGCRALKDVAAGRNASWKSESGL